MNVYNVIWADDDIDALKIRYEKRFNNNGVYIIGEAHNGEELEFLLGEKKNLVDAVIVDANFNELEIGIDDERDTSGLTFTRTHLLKMYPNTPFILFTQRSDELINEKYRSIQKKFVEEFPRHKRWFHKNDDDELTEMFDAIKSEVEFRKTDSFRIRNKYRQEFEAARLIPNAEDLLLKGIISEVTENISKEAIIESFNPVRMICEKIIDQCQEYEYIPYLNSLNSICDFLSQKEVEGFKLTTPIMHKTLVNSLEYFLSITQDGSHDKSLLPLEVIDYVRKIKNNNLYKSILYITMDLLLWFKNLRNDIPTPQNLWTGTYEAVGKVCIKKKGNRNVYIVNNLYQIEDNGKLKEGSEIIIFKSGPNRFPFENITKYVFRNNYKIKNNSHLCK